MKGGMQFFDTNTPPTSGFLRLYGNVDEKNPLLYKKKDVQTHLKTKDNVPLIFTLYNIESFDEYKHDTFDLSNLADDMEDIDHLFLCGFFTGLTRKELFIKKGKDNKGSFKAIGKTLHKLCENPKKSSGKIQIILAHIRKQKALCIIFNMSNIGESSYNLLKESLSDTSFSDDKILEGQIGPSQLENLIEFTNENLIIINPKTRFLLGLLFQNEKVEATVGASRVEHLGGHAPL